jgi:hypothetical protein
VRGLPTEGTCSVGIPQDIIAWSSTCRPTVSRNPKANSADDARHNTRLGCTAAFVPMLAKSHVCTLTVEPTARYRIKVGKTNGQLKVSAISHWLTFLVHKPPTGDLLRPGNGALTGPSHLHVMAIRGASLASYVFKIRHPGLRTSRTPTPCILGERHTTFSPWIATVFRCIARVAVNRDGAVMLQYCRRWIEPCCSS